MKELIEIQAELKAPKSQTNAFGKYKYRSCEDIVEAVKPLLKERNCLMTISDEMVEVGGRVYVKATVTIKNSAGDTESANGYARESETKKGMDDSQITGSASSYARKYACNGLLMIDDTKDADATNDHGKDEKGGSQNPPHPMYNWSVDFKNKIQQQTNNEGLMSLVNNNEKNLNDCTPKMIKEFKFATDELTGKAFVWPDYLKGK